MEYSLHLIRWGKLTPERRRTGFAEREAIQALYGERPGTEGRHHNVMMVA